MKKQDIEMIDHMMRASFQRSALMAFILHLFRTEEELTIDEIRTRVTIQFSRLIMSDTMVHDHIDKEVIKAMGDWGEGQMLVQEIKDLLK